MSTRTKLITAAVVPALAAVGFTALAAAPAANAAAAQPAAVATATGRQLVTGDHGSDVRTWQQDIDRVAGKIPGVPHIATDGGFGPRTAAATRAFQRYAHLTADGIVGPNTRSAMTTALHGSTTQPVLRIGDHGQAVRVWQSDLNAIAGTAPGLGRTTVDGIFGPRTLALTETLQSHAHITVDGIVGPRPAPPSAARNPSTTSADGWGLH